MLDIAKTAKDDTGFRQGIAKGYREWSDSVPANIKAKYPDIFPGEKGFDSSFAGTSRTLLNPWYQFFLHYVPANDIRRVQCPVLALDGDRDIQVDYKANLDLIRDLLTAAGNRHVETKAFPGLNHLFQHCQTCTIPEYGTLEETFSPEVLGVIGDWLDVNTGAKTK